MRLFLLIIFINFSIFSNEDNSIVDSTAVFDFTKLLPLENYIIATKSVEMLPDGLLKDLNNKKIKIHDILDSRPTLISFWFLACEPCKKEMKYLDEFNKKYAESGFQVISINTDNSRAFSSVKPYVNSKKYSFRILSDPRSAYQKKLKGVSCPFTVMVDHKGAITARHVGYNLGDEKKLELEILELIEKAATDTLFLEVKTE